MKNISEYQYRRLQVDKLEKKNMFIFSTCDSGLVDMPSFFCYIKALEESENYRLYVEFLNTAKMTQVFEKILMKMLVLEISKNEISFTQTRDGSHEVIYYDSDNLSDLAEVFPKLSEAINEISLQTKGLCLKALHGYLDSIN